MVAFIVGGIVAVVVETVLYPVKARDRLTESISSCLRQMTNMQYVLSTGVDSPIRINLGDERINKAFEMARKKAEAALTAAETFLPFCLSEPRLKGSFRDLQPVYKEILYVLHQIVDRIDGVVQLRSLHGSSVLEDLNPQVYAYRRNVSAAIHVVLFAVSEALMTGLPLPQFLPSARLAQLRLIRRVREVLLEVSDAEGVIQSVTAQRFLSWNAAAAGQMEIIEYLEELVDLAKILVGVNAFRSGMLERPSYRAYVKRIQTQRATWHSPVRKATNEQEGLIRRPTTASEPVEPVARLRRRTTFFPDLEAHEGLGRRISWEFTGNPDQTAEILPLSLQGVGTRTQYGDRIARRMTIFKPKNGATGDGRRDY
jgi:hypothetical protein